MARDRRCHDGGIGRVLDLIDDEGSRRALESDLMRVGLRLRFFGCGNPLYSWADLVAFIENLPLDSALVRHLRGDDRDWGLAEDLLAALVDRVGYIHYALTNDGRGEPPQPVSRWARAEAVAADVVSKDEFEKIAERDTSGVVRGDVLATEELARRFGWVE